MKPELPPLLLPLSLPLLFAILFILPISEIGLDQLFQPLTMGARGASRSSCGETTSGGAPSDASSTPMT